MTGFKEGASSDPYSDDGDEDDDELEGKPDHDQPTTTPSGQSLSSDRDPHTSAGGSDSSAGLPWIYERSSITSDRTTKQIHLQSETVHEETRASGELERRLGESVKKADVREAALFVGMQHLDEVAAQLREWGYDYSESGD